MGARPPSSTRLDRSLCLPLPPALIFVTCVSTQCGRRAHEVLARVPPGPASRFNLPTTLRLRPRPPLYVHTATAFRCALRDFLSPVFSHVPPLFSVQNGAPSGQLFGLLDVLRSRASLSARPCRRCSAELVLAAASGRIAAPRRAELAFCGAGAVAITHQADSIPVARVPRTAGHRPRRMPTPPRVGEPRRRAR